LSGFFMSPTLFHSIRGPPQLMFERKTECVLTGARANESW
jgi:hypothetical protein